MLVVDVFFRCVWERVVTDVDVQILFDMGHMLLWVWVVIKLRLRMWLVERMRVWLVVWVRVRVRVWLVMRVWHWLGIHLLGMGMGMRWIRVVLLECAFLESEGELRKLLLNLLFRIFGLGRLHRLWLGVPWSVVMLRLRLVPWIVWFWLGRIVKILLRLVQRVLLGNLPRLRLRFMLREAPWVFRLRLGLLPNVGLWLVPRLV